MRNKFKTLLCLSFLLFGCEYESFDNYYLIQIQNNSDFGIISYQASGSRNQPTMYPDTILPLHFYILDENEGIEQYVDSSDSIAIIPPKGCQAALECQRPKITKKAFNRHFISGVYSVFIIAAQTAQEKHWLDIRRDYDILVRYDLTYDNLKALNDTIPFPPSEAMKDMKMWPPYEEVVSKYNSSF